VGAGLLAAIDFFAGLADYTRLAPDHAQSSDGGARLDLATQDQGPQSAQAQSGGPSKSRLALHSLAQQCPGIAGAATDRMTEGYGAGRSAQHQYFRQSRYTLSGAYDAGNADALAPCNRRPWIGCRASQIEYREERSRARVSRRNCFAGGPSR
jgi:hypothetical protein